MRTSTRAFVSAALGGAAIVLTVTACSDSSSSSSSGSTAASAPAASSSAATSDQPPLSSNAKAVPGPNLPPASSVPPSKQTPSVEGTRCGTARGPEGALRVVVFPGSSAACPAVMPVALEYGPKIFQGTNQKVQGWDCGPSQTTGVLAKCTKGADSFGFLTD